MKHKSRNLGWLGVGSGLVWLYYTYIPGNYHKAIVVGWVTGGLVIAHIVTAR